jgi:hypothetical protein
MWTFPASDQLYEDGVAAANRGDSAVRVWLYASMAGHVQAQYYLGVAFAHGRGVPKDALQAKRCWTEAAAQGHVEAARQLEKLEAVLQVTTIHHALHLAFQDRGNPRWETFGPSTLRLA